MNIPELNYKYMMEEWHTIGNSPLNIMHLTQQDLGLYVQYHSHYTLNWLYFSYGSVQSPGSPFPSGTGTALCYKLFSIHPLGTTCSSAAACVSPDLCGCFISPEPSTSLPSDRLPPPSPFLGLLLPWSSDLGLQDTSHLSKDPRTFPLCYPLPPHFPPSLWVVPGGGL